MQSQPERRMSLESLEVSCVGPRVGGQATSYARFTDLAEMVCRVRQVTPDRPGMVFQDMELDTDPEESDILSEGEELEEGESGFISHITGQQADSRYINT